MKHRAKIFGATCLAIVAMMVVALYPTEERTKERELRQHPAAIAAMEEVKRQGPRVHSVADVKRIEKGSYNNEAYWIVAIWVQPKNRPRSAVAVSIADDGKTIRFHGLQ